MKQLFSHNFSSSVTCFVNWVLEQKGEALLNYSGLFKKVNTKYNGYTAYASPYSQFSYDIGVSGVNVPSGVFINNNFTPNNTNGLTIDYLHGGVYLTGNQNVNITAAFSAHEVNVYPTTEKEEVLFFENRYYSNPKNLPQWTGRLFEDKVVPCVFVKTKAGENTQLCFGDLEETANISRLVVISDDQFILDGINSLFRDAAHTYAPLLSPNQLPFNSFGNLQITGWNYNNYKNNASPNNLMYLESVSISEFTEQMNSFISEKCVGSIIDLNWKHFRFPTIN